MSRAIIGVTASTVADASGASAGAGRGWMAIEAMAATPTAPTTP
jgi:hypothetical protein